jgi:hypothetical protein
MKIKSLIASTFVATILTSCTQYQDKDTTNFKPLHNFILPSETSFQAFQNGKSIVPVIKGNGFEFGEFSRDPIMWVFSTGDVVVLSDKESTLNGVVLQAPAGAEITLKNVDGKIEAVY